MIGILSRKNSESISSHLLDTLYGVFSLLGVMHNRIQPNYYLSKFSPWVPTSDNRINPQSEEKAADGSRVDRILIMIEQRKDSSSQEGCHFHLNRARTFQESVAHNFAPKSLHLLV